MEPGQPAGCRRGGDQGDVGGNIKYYKRSEKENNKIHQSDETTVTE